MIIKMTDKPLTPKAIAALRLLRGTSMKNARRASALARMLWPEKMAGCSTSRRRGGLYRAAGGYYSKLVKLGLCDWWSSADFDGGYYITAKGENALSCAEERGE
jgi:hypothetical protein